MKKHRPHGGGNDQKPLQPANNAQPVNMARAHPTALNRMQKRQQKQIPHGKR